jgi:hypothetical protein
MVELLEENPEFIEQGACQEIRAHRYRQSTVRPTEITPPRA